MNTYDKDSAWFTRQVAEEAEKRRRELNEGFKVFLCDVALLGIFLLMLIVMAGCAKESTTCESELRIAYRYMILEKAGATLRLGENTRKQEALRYLVDNNCGLPEEKKKDPFLSSIGSHYDLFYAACECRESV